MEKIKLTAKQKETLIILKVIIDGVVEYHQQKEAKENRFKVL